jgi:hypothetical protein
VIEERDGGEVRRVGAQVTAPEASPVYNPAFDVTPAALIAAIVTERGVFRAPYHFMGGPEMAPQTPQRSSRPGEPGPLVDRAR